MDWRQFETLFQNLKGLGKQRLAALAGVAGVVIAVIAFGSYYATRASFETLYVGLTQSDVSRMGSVLAEAGIPFEATADGTKLGVPLGQAAEARALLAEKGLPGSPNAGYELFDKLGALGLTSFMQEVTRVRALEGELARTIQNLRGVKAARVHLVIPDSGSLRSRKQSPTASVVIRTEVPSDASAATAIRHLVAAAIPEMVTDQVSVIGTDGTVLAGAGQGGAEVPSKIVELERSMAQQVQDNVRRTLSPYLGLDHFEVSAAVRLNADKRQINETTYDPDKRVERSTRVVKEAQSAQENSRDANVSVDQNIPDAESSSTNKEQNKRSQDRKEETTNYEIGTKTTSVTSDGYRIENLSVAIVVNKRRLAESLGREPSDDELKKEIAEIEALAQSAAGIDMTRGDKINVAAVNFVPGAIPEAEGGSGWTMKLFNLADVMIKSLTVLAVASIVILAGLRPAMRTLSTSAALGGGGVAALESPAGSFSDSTPALDMPGSSPLMEPPADSFAEERAATEERSFSAIRRQGEDPQERLGQIIALDEEQATAVLRDWVRNG